MAEKHEEVKNGMIFPMGESNDAFSQYFDGQSYLKMLVSDADIPVSVGNVTFEPGCRNHWHIHHDGFQLLLVTGGLGWYQEEGQPARALKPGDVVVTKDGVKHWHGAAKDSWFSHIAITAGSAEWLEAVNEEDYQALGE
ncbi:MAG: cupin domain-containing protein [Aerococcus sp.]|nr:cupin domain-containing protein [Aerococcus sp.]